MYKMTYVFLYTTKRILFIELYIKEGGNKFTYYKYAFKNYYNYS